MEYALLNAIGGIWINIYSDHLGPNVKKDSEGLIVPQNYLHL